MSYMGTRGNIGESGQRRDQGTSMRRVWGGIEGGGTKFVCLIGTGPDELLATETIPTTDPQQTLGAAARFFERHGADTSLASLGIACFGPLDLNPASELGEDDPVWEDEARYLAHAAAVATLMISPQRIIFGGGVLKQEHLYARIRQQFVALLNGYVQSPAVTYEVASYIVAPQLGDHAGALEALALAMDVSRPE